MSDGPDPFADPVAFEEQILGREPLRPIPAPELMRMESQSGEELCGPILRRGQRLVVAGATGDGKTTFVAHLLGAFARAQDFLGWRGTGGRVLIVDAEQSVSDIQRLLTETSLTDCAEVEYLLVPDGMALDADERERNELELLIQLGRYDVVVSDPLYKLHRGDSSDERQAVDLMRIFDRWRVDYGFVHVLLAHTRKPPAGVPFTINEIFGSTAYVRGAEVVLGLQLVSEGFSRLHFLKDRSGGLPVRSKWDLTYSRGEGFQRAAGRRSTASELPGLLAAEPWTFTADDLARELRVSRRTVDRALAEIGARSQTVRDGRKVWALPQETEKEPTWFDEDPE